MSTEVGSIVRLIAVSPRVALQALSQCLHGLIRVVARLAMQLDEIVERAVKTERVVSMKEEHKAGQST